MNNPTGVVILLSIKPPMSSGNIVLVPYMISSKNMCVKIMQSDIE